MKYLTKQINVTKKGERNLDPYIFDTVHRLGVKVHKYDQKRVQQVYKNFKGHFANKLWEVFGKIFTKKMEKITTKKT